MIGVAIAIDGHPKRVLGPVDLGGPPMGEVPFSDAWPGLPCSWSIGFKTSRRIDGWQPAVHFYTFIDCHFIACNLFSFLAHSISFHLLYTLQFTSPSLEALHAPFIAFSILITLSIYVNTP